MQKFSLTESASIKKFADLKTAESQLLKDISTSKAKKIRTASRFNEIMRSMNYASKANARLASQKAEEEKAIRAKLDRQKRINELYALAAQLQQKLISSGYDSRVAAQLSAVKSELFWLLCAI